MVKQSEHVDDTALWALIFGDETSRESRQVAAHVEACAACQARLESLAVADGDAAEFGHLLSRYSGQELPALSDSCTSGDRLANGLAFLRPPSHPEMLGRLGRYEIESVIGSGGMGVVLKAFDTDLNRPVAIKVLKQHLAENGAARRRFVRESRAAAAVVDEHVVAIHNVESDGDVPFLVMQYVSGESLQARVERQGPLETAEILRIGIQAAAGLAAAHKQGLIHRDIKPANLLLETGVERTLLTDFGLARAMDDASLTQSGIVAGTPHYMSPEQANGQPVDQQSDLFSLGSVLYFMATGRPPFRAERPMAVLHRICRDRHRPLWEINADVPEELSRIIDRLLKKKPQRRPGSAADVQQALVALLSEVQQGRLRRQPWRRTHRKKRILAALAIASTIVVSAFCIRSWLEPRGTETQPIGIGPSVSVRSGDAYSDDLIPTLLSFGPGTEADFSATAAGIVADLNRSNLPAHPSGAFLQQVQSPWHVDFEAIGRDLLQLENLPYPDLTQQGEKR